MASNNKKTNTSKTAHVMNLLSKHREPAASSNDDSNETSGASSAVSSPLAAAPSILSSLNEESALSSQIKNALEDELGELPAENEAPPAEESVPDINDADEAVSAIEPDASDVPEEIPQEPVSDPEPVYEPEANPENITPEAENLSHRTPDASPFPLSYASQPVDSSETDPTSGTTYVNVMQALVEEMVGKYMDMFQVCTCARCKADVKALALNNLQPKYVVMRNGEMIPRITVYENKYSATVIAQILHACKQVMENPRHDS